MIIPVIDKAYGLRLSAIDEELGADFVERDVGGIPPSSQQAKADMVRPFSRTSLNPTQINLLSALSKLVLCPPNFGDNTRIINFSIMNFEMKISSKLLYCEISGHTENDLLHLDILKFAWLYF